MKLSKNIKGDTHIRALNRVRREHHVATPRASGGYREVPDFRESVVRAKDPHKVIQCTVAT